MNGLCTAVNEQTVFTPSFHCHIPIEQALAL